VLGYLSKERRQSLHVTRVSIERDSPTGLEGLIRPVIGKAGTSMSAPAWEFQHSAECKATRQFAWRFWTDIANWDDPSAEFDLDGPFESGARLTTTMPGQRWESVIRELKPEREATIEMQLPDAILSFHWKFEELSGDQTLITQRLVLSGPNAQSFVAQASIMEVSVPEGMKRLVAAIERAQRLTKT
jgi:hypothetical protein